ncbi:hypothetical protein CRG92_23815 [Escherichia sp. E2586]|nr:hypothetical protein CRG92_23815 [Escherichia sp. E2586]
MYNTKRIAWRAYKKGYHTGESIKWFSYFHSILTGACFTFFIGLFSVPPVNISNSFPLWWATLGFAISTLLNTGFSLFYIFASDEREFIFELHSYSKVGNLLIITSLALPVISFIMLLFLLLHTYWRNYFICHDHHFIDNKKNVFRDKINKG